VTRPGSEALLPLVCPFCAGPLPALEEDLAFACLRCRRAFQLEAGALTAIPLRVSPLPAHAGFHLPFWSFQGGAVVPAFNTRDVVPLTRRFSRHPVPAGDGEAAALVGASLAPEEAWQVAMLVGVAAVGTRPTQATLLGLPFLDEGNRLLDLATGVPLYKETIDRVETLVRASRGAFPDRA